MYSSLTFIVSLNIISVCFTVTTYTVADPLINTTSGTLQGITVSFEGVSVDIYKGVRYAEAPIGERRFSKPTPYASREGIYDATEFGPSCPQSMVGFPDGFLPNTDISEDCLMLNIYVPETATDDNKFAVIVWIHGGGFTSGQGMLYNGTPMTVYGDVIVVTINYRLGILAMMSTGDEHAKGNYGMFDQQLALRWVKENIGHFNGDTDRITIAGESAGGSSVLYHVLSPSSDGLFQRAIIQSAVFDYPIELSKTTEKTFKIASYLNCSENTDDASPRPNSEKVLECLRAVPVDTLLQTFNAVFQPSITGYQFELTLDRDFFPGSISSMITHSNMDKYDIMMGTVAQEGLVFSPIFQDTITTGISREHFDDIAKKLSITYPSNRNDIAKAIVYQYTNWGIEDDDIVRMMQIFNVLGDTMFYAPAVNFAKRRAFKDGKSLFYYNFAAKVPFPIYLGLTQTAGHGDELMYLWNAVNHTGVIPAFPPRDVVLSRAMMTYWSNFAKTGDPNNGGSTDDMVTWPQFTNEEQQYLELTYDLTVKSHPKAAAYSFWKEYLVDIGAPENSCPAAIAPPIQPTDTPITMETRPSVETTYGKVTGFTVKSHDALGGKNVDVFLGIPYAKPPTGSRRFRAPQTTDSWTELNVTQYAPACPQPDRPITSEDCLYLNIFTPSRDNNNLLPVMVIIHGDRFTNGDSSDYAGDVIAAYGDVVVVTLNYRLGILGFLSTENDTLPGNYAFHDILFALEWIRGDVINFGGNPDQVTLAGFKAGAVAVQFLMTSPLSRDLFHRVICLSGSSLSPLAANVNKSALRAAEHFITQVDCVEDSESKLLSCLRNVNVEDIIWATTANATSFPYPPVIDGEIVIGDSSLSIASHGFLQRDLMLGFTNGEMTEIVLSRDTATANGFHIMVTSLTESYFEGNKDLIDMAILRQYPTTGHQSDVLELASQLLDMTNDFSIYAPIAKTAKIHSSAGGHVYMYHFTQRLSQSLLPPWVGPAQGDDLRLLLGDPFMTSQHEMMMSFNNQERKLSLYIMTYVTNFVKTGNPNTGRDVPVHWSKFSIEEPSYLELDVCPVIKTGFREEQMSFWNQYLPLVEEITKPQEINNETPTENDELEEVENMCTGDKLGMNMSVKQATYLIIGLIITIIVITIVFSLILVAVCRKTDKLSSRKKAYAHVLHSNGTINEDTQTTHF
ncbi:uncharacterized protein LOC144438580 [Glandiceps talaboti]